MAVATRGPGDSSISWCIVHLKRETNDFKHVKNGSHEYRQCFDSSRMTF
jgi:hypothetical protein